MNQPVTQQPLPVLQILAEAARLHWSHILVFLAAAALYATPIMLALSTLSDELTRAPEDLTPQLMETLAPRIGLILLVGIPLSAALFAFWVRLTLMGPRAALFDQAAGWPLRILRVASLFVLAWIIASITLVPISLLLSIVGQSTVSQYLIVMLMVFTIAFYLALFSRWLVETSLDIPRGSGSSSAARTVVAPQAHLRLGALFSAVILGLLVIQTLVQTVLIALGATLTAQVGTGMFLTLVITAYASIHAIVYRMRTVPPRAG